MVSWNPRRSWSTPWTGSGCSPSPTSWRKRQRVAEKVERISFNESNIVLGSVWKNQCKAEAKFDHFKGIVGGEVYDPLPIRFLRISELTILGDMLKQAMQFA